MSWNLLVRGASKRFMVSHHRPTSLRERFIRRHPFGGRVTELWALRDIDLCVAPGEIFGVLGANGSGKSTLLRLVAGVMEPTKGEVTTSGRVGALLDLAAGFHPELTGLENIELNGALLGMRPEEVRERRDEIVAFSDLEGFIDSPVKYYSSGMLMRLGFSISIHLDPDILLVDEVLAVGDESYQRRCLDRIDALRDQGKSILLVTHDMQQVRQMCTRALWLKSGEAAASGPVEEVVGAYLEFTDRTDAVHAGEEQGDRWGSREIEIVQVEMIDGNGHVKAVFSTGDPCAIRIHYKAHHPVESPVVGYAVFRSDGLHVTGPNTRTGRFPLGAISGTGIVEHRVESLPLLPGAYYLSVAIYDRHIRHPYDHQDKLHRFRVGKGKTLEKEGIVTFQGMWDHIRMPD